MIATFLLAFLAIQDVPVAPIIQIGAPGGTITGIVRSADGRPAVGARVSALAKPEAQETTGNSAMAAIAATDEEGRYRLEDIPPGQYYVVAGRVDLPTYYPGTTAMSAGTIVRVTSGAVLAGYDFSMGNNSVRTASTDVFREPVGARPLFTRVVTEDGGKIPISSANGRVRIYFERQADGAETLVPITSTTAILQYLLALPLTEYRVEVQNLPEGYAVKSLKYGTTDITANGTLQLSSANPAPVYRNVATTAGNQLVAFPPSVSPDNLTITLEATAAKNAGVVVRGSGLQWDRPIYMSGRQGIGFSDGTYEFRNVPPGRHTIAVIDAPGRARGTTLIVGDQNLENVTLVEVSNLPSDIQTPVPPGPTGGKPAGTRFAPVALHGRVVAEKGAASPTGGQVLVGDTFGPTYSLDADGKFVIQGLLPGVYNIEIQMFGYSTVHEEVTVGVDDARVDLTTQKL